MPTTSEQCNTNRIVHRVRHTEINLTCGEQDMVNPSIRIAHETILHITQEREITKMYCNKVRSYIGNNKITSTS